MISRFALVLLTLGLAACDKPADETAQEVSVVEAASGGPATEASSTSGNSPGGAAVTEQELPQSDVPPPSREVFHDASCDFKSWVGKPVDETAVKETGRVYRILPPNSMMTMDHSPERINVEHDENKIVTRVWCG